MRVCPHPEEAAVPDTKTPPLDPFADGAMTVAQATQFSGLGRSSLYELMTAGELPFIKIGCRRLIPRRALIDLLVRHANTPAA